MTDGTYMSRDPDLDPAVGEALSNAALVLANRRIEQLEKAIREHRAQKADDRCIEDDDKLYATLGDGIRCDRRVGSKEEMLANCQRFIERRCEAGGWPSYAELEGALEESVKLQSHYASLLNMYDGGRRLTFPSAA